jgi:hypothetical protein
MRRREWLMMAAGGAQRLTGAQGRAFRGWFCWLAEVVFHLPQWRRPKEIKDCSSLARFAYREALRKHDAAWLAGWGFPAPPPLAEAPAGVAPLFRVEGEQARHFADAASLMRHNTRFVSKDCGAAAPGDLLFYRQPTGAGGYHMMVYLGPSLCDGSSGPYVVYHTGPEGGDPGEMRRPALAELMRHPEPRWRPAPGNPAFLGVFRWNLLNGGEG